MPFVYLKIVYKKKIAYTFNYSALCLYSLFFHDLFSPKCYFPLNMPELLSICQCGMIVRYNRAIIKVLRFLEAAGGILCLQGTIFRASTHQKSLGTGNLCLEGAHSHD